MRLLFVFVFLLGLVSCGEEPKQPKQKKLTELEKKVETFFDSLIPNEKIISIEWGEKKKFNIDQLIKDHNSSYEPSRKYNEKAFKELKRITRALTETVGEEGGFAYSMRYTYGLPHKTKRDHVIDITFVIVLFDKDLNIISYINYRP